MYKGKEWGQIFGLFKRIYFIDRHLEQKVVKQKLRYNGRKVVISSRSTNNIKNNADKQLSKCKYKKWMECNFYFPGTILKQFG